MNQLIRKLRDDRSWVILVTVILLTIVLSIVAISIMSLRVSQVTSGQSVVDGIKAEQIAVGAFYKYHQQRANGCLSCPTPGDCSSCSTTSSESLNGKTYTITIQNDGALQQANDAEQIKANIAYN